MAGLNADFSKCVVMRTASMEWQASPSPSVWRKRLDLSGPAEAGRVTSLVRYDANSRFPPHEHPDGEEILVLEGTLSDEHGDYPAGTYLLNPEGFRHAPFSDGGCVLLVKLRQYPGTARRHVVVDTNTAPWQAGDAPGHEVLLLYREDGHPERIRLERLAPGAALPAAADPGGREMFVIAGGFEDAGGRNGAGDWLRLPPGGDHRAASADGCVLYVKSGHLGMD